MRQHAIGISAVAAFGILVAFNTTAAQAGQIEIETIQRMEEYRQGLVELNLPKETLEKLLLAGYEQMLQNYCFNKQIDAR